MAFSISFHRYAGDRAGAIAARGEPSADAVSWKADALATAFMVVFAVALWVPRFSGPIDMRWDGSVYYILGTSLAEGRGYKILSEPGEIDAVQYPPLLPAIVAGHALLAGTTDPTIVGQWLRLSTFFVFVAYAVLVLRFLRGVLRLEYALVGSIVSVLAVHAWFMSDVLFPEIWFSVATLLFLLSARRPNSTKQSVLTYIWAVVGYGLRTIGIAAFGAWIAESILHRRFKQALLRAVLALVPFAAWQGYVASVERSPEYRQPAYAYQRAPYLFYNVSYARNVALRDPFTPEKGPVRIERRIARNSLQIPVQLGGTLSTPYRFLEMWVHRVTGSGPTANLLVHWGVFAVLSTFGALLVFGGIGVQLWRRQLVEPLYLLAYIAVMCLVPFPEQYQRYFMPVTPLVASTALLFLGRIGRKAVYLALVPAIGLQLATAASVFITEHPRVDQVDAAGRRLTHRKFFYDQSQRQFDEAIDYLQKHAAPNDVVAAGTPHWIYLRSGLKTVMPPFEADPAKAAALLDDVPVRYLVAGRDVIGSERYVVPVLLRNPDGWRPVYSTRTSEWTVYERIR